MNYAIPTHVVLLQIFLGKGTIRPTNLKLGTQVDREWLYCAYESQIGAAYSSLNCLGAIYQDGRFIGNVDQIVYECDRTQVECWCHMTLAARSTRYSLSVIVLSLNCYKCHSFNNTDPHCGDPFHPFYGNYVKDCTAGKENRIGEFPARHCIKLIGTTGDGIEMVFRGCSLESLDSQCGEFKFEEVRYKGCVTSCDENGCNVANNFNFDLRSRLIIFLTAIVFQQFMFRSFTTDRL